MELLGVVAAVALFVLIVGLGARALRREERGRPARSPPPRLPASPHPHVPPPARAAESRRERRKDRMPPREAWSQAALLLGCGPRASFLGALRIEAALPTGAVTIDTLRRSSEKPPVTFTRYRAWLPAPLGLGIRIERRRYAPGPGHLLPGVDARDVEFDEKVMARAEDLDRLREHLTPERRRRILEALDAFPGLRVDDRAVHWEERNVERDPGRLVESARRLSSLADLLGRREAVLVSDPGPGPDAEPVHEPEPVPVNVPVPAPPPAPDLDAARACEDLFAPGRSSVDAARAFEERYRGKAVRWRGVLRSADEYVFDLALGGGPGTKALLEVGRVNEAFGTSPVHAVVGLAPGRAASLRERSGAAFEVVGTIREMDGLMRGIVLADGRLFPV